MPKVTSALVLAMLLGGTSATLAQTYPAESNTAQVQKTYRGDQAREQAYGQPRGPVYMHTTGPEKTPDPRTCGPGACQDNPHY